MSMPYVPDIKPEIKLDRNDVIYLIIASIALEELGLAHIINAEGEKIQEGIKFSKSIDDLIKVNKSVEKTLRNVIKKEMLLQFKFEDAIEMEKDHKYH